MSKWFSVSAQNINFKPIWSCLPVAEELDSFPKFALPSARVELLAAGKVNVGVLLTLKASARNWRFQPS